MQYHIIIAGGAVNVRKTSMNTSDRPHKTAGDVLERKKPIRNTDLNPIQTPKCSHHVLFGQCLAQSRAFIGWFTQVFISKITSEISKEEVS